MRWHQQRRLWKHKIADAMLMPVERVQMLPDVSTVTMSHESSQGTKFQLVKFCHAKSRVEEGVHHTMQDACMLAGGGIDSNP
jgi:hypothetical protein